MRVLVASTAGAGHWAGLLPFALACVASGHDVRVAAPASFATTVEAAGLVHEPFADADPAEIGAVFARIPALTMPEADDLVVTEVFGRLDARAALPGVQALVGRWRPDLVLREPAELASYVVAERAGIPHIQTSIGLGRLDTRLLPLLDEPLGELGCTTAGLRSAPRWTIVPPAFDDAAALVTGPVTAARDPRAVVPSGGPLPDWWADADSPLVYVTFGSVAAGMGLFPLFYAEVLRLLADLPVRVLLTVGGAVDPAALGALPTNAHVERWWRQADVMPHAAAVVGHGGFGTTQAALVAGVPQVALPLFSFDQFLNAERIAAVGVGVALVAEDPGVQRAGDVLSRGLQAVKGLPAAVTAVVDDGAHRSRARALAAEVGSLPTTDDLVARLVTSAASDG